MSPETLKVLDLLVRVLFYGAIYFVAWIAILSPLPLWNKYKKNRDKEKKETERIIVKMADDIKKDADRIATLNKTITDLDKQIAEKKEQLEQLASEQAANEVPEAEIVDEHPEITVAQLRITAKEKGIKGFSRMSKEKLLKTLGY